jgi:hypothetical protein
MRPERLELPTDGFEARRSILLSYGRAVNNEELRSLVRALSSALPHLFDGAAYAAGYESASPPAPPGDRSPILH